MSISVQNVGAKSVNKEVLGRVDNMNDEVNIMTGVVLFGGPQAGFNTNPETKIRPCYIEINGEKLVCLAQGGECRYNYKYYTPGMGDAKSWRTPIIDEDCPDRCGYKAIVCDNHEEKCEGSIEYYPHYNKFRGQFKKYCWNFEKFLGKKGIEKGK
jgi:hypothetical protein